MKKLAIGLSLIAMLLLGACSATTNDSKETTKREDKTEVVQKQASTNKLGEAIVVDGMELTLKQLKTTTVSKNEGKETKSLYGFEINGKNISSAKLGLGAIDFVVTTTDGKEHSIDDAVSNFGNEIEPDKTISGKAYFSIDKGQKIEKIQYKPVDKVLVSWNVEAK